MSSIIVCGDSQAHAIAVVLDRLFGTGNEFRVFYLPDNVQGELAESDYLDCVVLLEQSGSQPFRHGTLLPKICRRISFPRLDFQLLWPHSTINPYNGAEPEFPNGKFPYGNSFILSGIDQGFSAEDILQAYNPAVWSPSWPNLDALFVAETARLSQNEADCNIKICSFILKNFRRERLFSAPQHPTNRLLEQMVLRVLRASFGSDSPVEPAQVADTLAAMGTRDLLGIINLPIHPLVAKHFDLLWYDCNEQYDFFGQYLSHGEYYKVMTDTAMRFKGEGKRSPLIARKPTLIVYGNCQAEAVKAIIEKYPMVTDKFEPIYLRSYDHPADGWQELAYEDAARCEVLFEQHDKRAFPYGEQLPANCKVVKFPSLDFNLLWPFNRVNPYNRPELPDFPFGRFPYGDSVIVDCIDKHLSASEIADHYFNGWESYAPALDRLLTLEEARLTARDKRCDVKMGRFIIDKFREQQLFWTVNHPTSVLLRELILKLFEHAFATHESMDQANMDAIRSRYFAEDPLGAINVPVHPEIAKRFALQWYDPRARYAGFGNKTYNYETYFKTMIAASLKLDRTLKGA